MFVVTLTSDESNRLQVQVRTERNQVSAPPATGLTKEENNTFDCPIVGHGRLDNRLELASILNSIDQGRELSDMEFIGECYRRSGPSIFGRLCGEFAFVLADPQQNVAFCVRDPLGLRPLYYSRRGRQILVGTRISSIQAMTRPEGDRFDERSISAYLSGDIPESQLTFFSDICRVPAGSYLQVKNGDTRLVRYWDPREIRLTHHDSLDDYAADFRERFLKAVAARLPRGKAGSVGLHLSGGFDSSAVVAAAHWLDEHEGRDLKMTAFVNLAQHPNANERTYMESMLSRYPMEMVTTRAEDYWGFREAVGVDLAVDEPFLGFYVSRGAAEIHLARQLGIGAIFSGTGGDEIGGSSMYLADLFIRGRWSTLWPELRSRSEGKGQSVRSLLRMLLSAHSSWARRLVSKSRASPPNWLGPKLSCARLEHHSSQSDYSIIRTPAREHLFRSLEFCWSHPLFGLAYENWTETGIQFQFPFLDRRLFEWALSVPPYRLGFNGRVKAPLRRALADLLPEAVANRSTKGRYGSYLDLGLRQKEQSRILAMLANPLSAEMGYIDPGPLRAAYSKYLSGHDINRNHFWHWLTFERWIRIRLNRRSGEINPAPSLARNA